MRAIVDANGVLQGVSEDGNGPEVPPGFDLQPGKYRWHADRRQWWPLTQAQFTPEDAPDATEAIAAGFAALRAAGTPLPEITTRWLDWYARTFDARLKKGARR